ncbi:MAG: hypothetical protein JWM14_135 [Chitinophagaceae bacterium]|nr:hypothetical protein [Chitinophagaceae bacterium]
MKHFVTTLFTLAFVLAFTLACKKSSDDAPAPSSPTLQNRIEKKWNVSTTPAATGRVSAGADDYTSFEFTDEGKYFIIKADKSQLKGNFTLTVGDSILTLDGLGKIYIDEITETQIIFRLVLTGTSDEVTVTAAPATTVSTSQNTQNLVNSWSFKSRKVNGTPDAAVNSAFSSGGYYLYVTLTDYGTYSVETNVPGTPSQIGIWKWCNTQQTTFGASSNPDVEPTCTGMNVNTVSFNSDGDLVLTATINSNVQEDTYVTKP